MLWFKTKPEVLGPVLVSLKCGGDQLQRSQFWTLPHLGMCLGCSINVVSCSFCLFDLFRVIGGEPILKQRQFSSLSLKNILCFIES